LDLTHNPLSLPPTVLRHGGGAFPALRVLGVLGTPLAAMSASHLPRVVDCQMSQEDIRRVYSAMDKEEVLRRVGFAEAVPHARAAGGSRGVGTIVSRTRIELRPKEVMVRQISPKSPLLNVPSARGARQSREEEVSDKVVNRPATQMMRQS
jgi:hypothetical protein